MISKNIYLSGYTLEACLSKSETWKLHASLLLQSYGNDFLEIMADSIRHEIKTEV